MTEKNDAFGAAEPMRLTEEQRRENVAAVRSAEESLERVEQRLISEILELVQTVRIVNEARDSIRKAFGLEPAERLPPLVDAAEKLEARDD